MRYTSFFVHLHTWILYLFIFLLPTQLGTFFFISQSYIDGIRIDYLAPALYGTDILVIILAFVYVIPDLIRNLEIIKNWILNLHQRRIGLWSKVQDDKLLYVLISLFLILNIAFALSPIISIYKLIKLAELAAVFWMITKSKIQTKHVLVVFLSMSILQLVLVIFQVTQGHSMQGVAYFLGERSFSLSTPGIAKISLQGIELIRGYGTFSHPNSLAGFYLLLYGFVSFYQPFDTYRLLRKIFLTIAIVLILFSFSKIAIIGLLGVMVYSSFKNKTNCFICRTSQLILPIVLGVVFLSGVGDPESLDKRLWLTASSFQIIQNYLFTGVGLGNYLVAQSTFSIPYPYFFLQPVHNIFLLSIAELGIPLFILIMYLLKNTIQTIWKSPAGKAVIIIVVFTGLFDHYWLTLQQNMLLMPVVFGLLQKHKSMVK